jgi:hypothetical protein
MDLFVPMATVMIARAASADQAKLAPTVAEQALVLADANPEWPPSLMLRLQGLALTGDIQAAQAEARQILEQSAGVALTRRWADRILRRLPPYDR